jgi:23S rRNA (guanosine2251-2'-O)-methyltransferase
MEALLPPGAVHQGHAALVAPLPIVAIEDLIAEAGTSANALIVVLDQVNDPQNIGAILRSAAVFGALGVIVQDRHAPEVTGSMAKAASGAVERVPLVRVTNIVRSLETLKDAGFWTTGLDSNTDISIEQTPANNRNILILGAEGPGLRRLTRDACDLLVRIGERQTGERLLNSLNVSNAAAVALYALSSRQPKT